MQYKHAFHAGNFADVHKHIVLLQLLEALKKKAKGFLYLDTHSGEGGYDLASPDARHGDESHAGVVRLETAAASVADLCDQHIRRYLDAVAGLRAASGGRSSFYPGSPLLAINALRSADTAVCVESQAPVSRALQRALDQHAGTAAVRPRVIHGDGYREIRAQLPPPSRRGLILIDPPYESADEERSVRTALDEGLARFETGVFAIWYPIKRRYDSDLWLARMTRDVPRTALAAEFCLHEPDHTAGLNGSGMLVINPPWEFDTNTHAWQVQLEELLGARGGSRVHWLVREVQSSGTWGAPS